MRRLIGLLIFACALTAFSSAWAGEAEPYTVTDGDVIERDRAALFLYGGYPRSGFAYIAAPWDYIAVGFQFDAEYHPAFAMGAPWKFQLLESAGETLNFALTIHPALYFNFERSNAEVLAWMHPGFAAGWHFYRSMALTLNGRYAVILPISNDATFSHHPIVELGFEFPLGRNFNLALKGLTEFENYEPDDFVYGGLAAIGLLL